MSLGEENSDALNSAVTNAYQLGILTVVSAGNNGSDASRTSPASTPEAITVSAIGPDNTRPSWASFGPPIDVFAPGIDVKSAFIGPNNNEAATLSGTSMAAPHVAGLVLYLKSIDPVGNAKAADVTDTLKLATAGVVINPGLNTANLLAYNGNGA
ncbi:serine protease [Diplogelasinospora grovesii]|uniref:Serine protease n=1 Tax=Diplogelasinospora grovesii TaxID=303347 RepID=A0AAN6MX70_9PEZI|nr:serine protease [Diplogelasinospora grovesii]